MVTNLSPADFVAMVARMKTEEEYGDQSPASEDWICTLNNVIETARQIRRQAALSYLQRPHVCTPMNALHGLYTQILSHDGSASAADLLAFVRADVAKAGYDPDGKGSLGGPSQHGIRSLSYSLWFYEETAKVRR